MESIKPSLELAYHVKRNLKAGRSMAMTIKDYLRMQDRGLHDNVMHLYQNWLENQPMQVSSQFSPNTTALMDLIWFSLNGKSIDSSLNSWIANTEKLSEIEMDAFIAKLPFRLLLPLMFLQVPAFLMVLFGPIIEKFMESL